MPRQLPMTRATIKSRLVENKALLEVILALVGLVSAILLGGMAISVSRAANRIAERQAALAEAQASPWLRFELDADRVPLDLPDTLRVFNEGSPLEQLTIQQLPFLELWSRERPSWEHRYLPVYYFGDRYYTGNTTGLLCTLKAHWSDPIFPSRGAFPSRGDAKAHIASLRENLRDPGSALTAERLRLFLLVSYVDALGEWRSVAYEVNPEWDLHRAAYPRRLSADDVHSLQQLAFPPAPSIPFTVTPEQLQVRWPALIPHDGRHPQNPFSRLR